ncbi:hypothetical protein BKA70DRAFT_1465429 [Coprinopsis sp. MPI-PUGE-AT-0042]|nr:hypothetical protein BKA70DRAFT_1465429 [Coprinopsis sp. MPI-PUGE-AT-0042]
MLFCVFLLGLKMLSSAQKPEQWTSNSDNLPGRLFPCNDTPQQAYEDLVYCVSYDVKVEEGTRLHAERLFSSTDSFDKEQKGEDLGMDTESARSIAAFTVAIKQPSSKDTELYLDPRRKEWGQSSLPSRLEHEAQGERSQRHQPNRDGVVDWEWVHGIDGIGLANVVVSAQEVKVDDEGRASKVKPSVDVWAKTGKSTILASPSIHVRSPPYSTRPPKGPYFAARTLARSSCFGRIKAREWLSNVSTAFHTVLQSLVAVTLLFKTLIRGRCHQPTSEGQDKGMRTASALPTIQEHIEYNSNWGLSTAVKNGKDRFDVATKIAGRPLRCAVIPSSGLPCRTTNSGESALHIPIHGELRGSGHCSSRLETPEPQQAKIITDEVSNRDLRSLEFLDSLQTFAQGFAYVAMEVAGDDAITIPHTTPHVDKQIKSSVDMGTVWLGGCQASPAFRPPALPLADVREANTGTRKALVPSRMPFVDHKEQLENSLNWHSTTAVRNDKDEFGVVIMAAPKTLAIRRDACETLSQIDVRENLKPTSLLKGIRDVEETDEKSASSLQDIAAPVKFERAKLAEPAFKSLEIV